MAETELHTQIWRFRAAFLLKIARSLGLEADEENVRELVRTHDDEAVLVAIESTQGWSIRRTMAAINQWFTGA